MDMQSRLVSFLVVAGERHLLKRMEFRGWLLPLNLWDSPPHVSIIFHSWCDNSRPSCSVQTSDFGISHNPPSLIVSRMVVEFRRDMEESL
uniref:Uncharacterized protein n=1 Tax=Physcomitrium patens TaxID=3218 RepID=A0A7I4AG89_PHYPA